MLRLLLVCKSCDYLPKGEQTLIDIDGFFVSLVSSEGLSLTASQVYHLKLARDDIIGVFGINLLNGQT